jgi:cytochrome c peroxidase
MTGPVKTLFLVVCGVGMIGAAAHAVQNIVSQKGKMFSPEDLTGAAGGIVQIDNDDNIPHNTQVTGPDGESKNFGLQMPGEHVAIAIEKPGDYMVRCGIHPKMKLVIHAN